MRMHSPRPSNAANRTRLALRAKIKVNATLLTAATTLGLLFSVEAHAGFIGQTMSASYRVPTVNDIYSQATWTPPTFTVGSGEETVGNIEDVTALHVDFTDSKLLITLNTILSTPTWNIDAFNGPVFTANAPLYISGASIDPATTMSGFDVSRVTWTGDSILLNWNGLSYIDGTVVAVDFTVPEPRSLAVMGVALIGLCMIRYRRPSLV